MKKLSFFLFIIVFLGCMPINIFAISARSAVVMDMASGRILYSHNKDEKLGMASTTKIMTAICALEYGDPEMTVTISKTASGVEGSSMYLRVGEKLKLIDLIYGLMLVSGNDAATAIAESVSGSVEEFSVLMNKKAFEIGAFNTSFTNPHGLSDKNHYTTASDLAKITAYAMKNPLFQEIVKSKSKKLPQNEGGMPRYLVNHNKFLSMYDGCVGVKTGFTKATGRCLVTAAERNNMTLISVTLNAPDDWRDHKELLDSAFTSYSPYKIKNAGEVIGTSQIKKGTADSIELVTLTDIFIPVKPGEETSITTSFEPYEDLTAPVKRGDILGRLIVKSGEIEVGEFPLVAKTDIELKPVIFKAEYSFSTSLKKVFWAWLTCFK